MFEPDIPTEPELVEEDEPVVRNTVSLARELTIVDGKLRQIEEQIGRLDSELRDAGAPEQRLMIFEQIRAL